MMDLLTLREAADAMKVSESTVRRLVRQGSLTAYKVGDRGQLRIKRDDLERYVESQIVRVEETAPAKQGAMESEE